MFFLILLVSVVLSVGKVVQSLDLRPSVRVGWVPLGYVTGSGRLLCSVPQPPAHPLVTRKPIKCLRAESQPPEDSYNKKHRRWPLDNHQEPLCGASLFCVLAQPALASGSHCMWAWATSSPSELKSLSSFGCCPVKRGRGSAKPREGRGPVSGHIGTGP